MGKEKKGKRGSGRFVGFCRMVRAGLADKVVFYSTEGLGVSLGMLVSGRHGGRSGPSLSRHSEGTVLGAGVVWTVTGVRVGSRAQFMLLGAEAGRKIQGGYRFEKGTL